MTGVLSHTLCTIYFLSKTSLNESMVSFVSRRYMRVVIGTIRLVVCLSEYLPLRSVYRISSMSMIAV